MPQIICHGKSPDSQWDQILSTRSRVSAHHSGVTPTHSQYLFLPSCKIRPYGLWSFHPSINLYWYLIHRGKKRTPISSVYLHLFQFLAQNAVEFLTHAITRNKHSRICWQFFLFPDWTYSQCSIFKSYLAMSFLPSVGFCCKLKYHQFHIFLFILYCDILFSKSCLCDYISFWVHFRRQN